MLGEPQAIGGYLEFFWLLIERTPAFKCLTPSVLPPHVVPQCARRIAHGRTGPVGDDIRHLRRMGTPIPFIYVLDYFFAPVGGNIDINIGRAIPLRGKKTFK